MISNLSSKKRVFREGFFHLKIGEFGCKWIINEILSNYRLTRPNRSSLAKSTTGAKIWFTPNALASCAMVFAISWTSYRKEVSLEGKPVTTQSQSYVHIPRASIRNRWVENGSITDQKSVNTCRLYISNRQLINPVHHLDTFSLNESRNSESGIMN